MASITVKLKNKLSSKDGESITETLVALLIMTMVMLVFAGSVVTAARINDKASHMVTATHMDAIYDELTTSDNTVYVYDCDADGTHDASSVDQEMDVTVTKETHKDEKYGIEDSFYFYAVK